MAALRRHTELLIEFFDGIIAECGKEKHAYESYVIPEELNAAMKADNPKAIVVAGKVNRIWYEEACLKAGAR